MEECQEIRDDLEEEDDTPEKRERDLLNTLNNILENGNLQAAKQFCEGVLSYCPGHPLFNFHLGNVENQLGNYESAKRAFILSYQNDHEDNPRTLFNIGYVCFRLDEFQLAIGAYLTAIEALQKEEQALAAAGGFSIDHLPLDRIYQNLGIAQSCFACTLIDAEPIRAIQLFKEAIASFDNVIALVDGNAKGEPNEITQEQIDQVRVNSAVFRHAFVNKLQALENLIDLKDAQASELEKKLGELIAYGLDSQALVDERRDVQRILWRRQQANGIAVPVERVITEDFEFCLGGAKELEAELQAILAWHQEDVDWPALYKRHNEVMRYFNQLYQQRKAGENDTPEKLDGSPGSDDEEAMSPVQKKHCSDTNQRVPELAEDAALEVKNPSQGDNQIPRETDKVDRLNQELYSTMTGNESFPYAFSTMLSSPEFLRLHGWYRFGGRLPHVIHESYTYFYQHALFYNERLTSACLKKLHLAGLRISQNNNVDALLVITQAMDMLAEHCPNYTPRFMTDMHRPNDPEIQVKRRKDLFTISTLYIRRFYFNAELLFGVVSQLMGQDEKASEAFERCYDHVDKLESILKQPQHTEILRQIKDENRHLQMSKLHKVIRDCERKIPEKLKARIKRLEDFLQQDVLRITIENASIPFPYDRFREGFDGINKELQIPEHANVSNHVISVCYLMPDGSPQVSSFTLNTSGVVFDLYNMAVKRYGVDFNTAKVSVVNKVNYGKKVFEDLSETKKQLPSLAFMRHVESRNAFDDKVHKHSEQVFYFVLDRHDPNDLIHNWVQDSKGKFTPECTVVGVISDMKSVKTGCPNCKASALATQNPHHEDNTAFLNRLHAALKVKGYKLPVVEATEPKLQMVTRIRAFEKDSHAKAHGLHENPLQRSLTNQENLAILEKLESSSFVSGYRKGIY